MNRWGRVWPAGTAVLLAASISASDLAAQDIEVTGYVGAVLPLSSLGAEGDSVRAELSTRPSFAASVDFWFTESIGLGVMGGYTKPELNFTTAGGTFGQETVNLGTADYLHGEALLLFRPDLPGSSSILLPYFGVGAGIRDLSVPEGEGFADGSDIVFVVAGGSHIRVSDAIHLRLDVRDLISSFDSGPFADSNVQHDVFVQVGVGFGL